MKKYIFLLFGFFQLLYIMGASAQTLTATRVSATTLKLEISNVYTWSVDENVGGNWSTLIDRELADSSNNPRIYYYDRPAGKYTFRLNNRFWETNVTTYDPVSVTLEGVGAPPTPTNFTASLGSYSVVLNWSASIGATRYELRRAGTLLTPAGTSYSDSGVNPGNTYGYTVSACNATNQCSAPTPVVNIYYPAVPVVNSFTASLDGASSSVKLNWSVSSDGATIELWRDQVKLTTSLNASPYYDSGILAGSHNTYYFIACNAANVCMGGPMRAIIDVPPIPPVPTVNAVFNGATASISWSSTDAVSYQVQRDDTNLNVGGTSYYDNQLVPHRTVVYKVKACNVIGQCSAAGSASVVVPDGPMYELKVTGNNSFAVLAANVYAWHVELSKNNGAAWEVLDSGPASGTTPAQMNYTHAGGSYLYHFVNNYTDGTTSTSSSNSLVLSGSTPPPAPTFNMPVVGASSITISWSASSGATYYNLTRIGLLISSSSATSYIDTNVVAGNIYGYGVSACNAFNDCSAEVSIISGLPPVSPTLTAITGSAAVNLSWNAPNGAASYQLKRETTLLTSSGSPYTDSSCTAGVTYNYSIVACNSINQCSLPYTKVATCPSAPVSSSSSSSVPSSSSSSIKSSSSSSIPSSSSSSIKSSSSSSIPSSSSSSIKSSSSSSIPSSSSSSIKSSSFSSVPSSSSSSIKSSSSSSVSSSSSIKSSSSSARSIGPIKYTYDALGRVVKVEDSLNGTRDYKYDPAGNRTQLNVQTISSSSSSSKPAAAL